MPDSCPYPEAHEAHMQMNGECPWCDIPSDPTRIREPEDYDFQDAHTVQEQDHMGSDFGLDDRPLATNYPRRGDDPIEDTHAAEGEKWTYGEHGW